jgi:glycine oxidase
VKTPTTVAVIGGGIIGCSIAWALGRAGVRVLLIDDRAAPLQGISAAGFGSLTPFSDPFYRGEARDFAARSVQMFREEWLADICSASRSSVAFKDLGLIQLCLTTEDEQAAVDLSSELIAAGYDARLLSAVETRRLEPALSGTYRSALWMNEPWVDRAEYFAALLGAIATLSSVEQFARTKIVELQPRIDSLRLVAADGREFECDAVVLCQGLTTGAIVGVPTLPLQWVRGDAISVHTTNGAPILTRHVYCHKGFITPRDHSEMLLGTTYEPEDLPSDNARAHRDRIALADFKRIISANCAILPGIDSLEVGAVWRNWRPTAPDEKPVLGALQSDERILLANGFIGLGITLSPAVAVAVANQLTRSADPAIPATFSPNRYHYS